MRCALSSRVPAVLLATATALVLPMTTGTAVGHVAAHQGPPCSGANVDACVDLSEQQAWLMSGGAVTYGPVPISSGSAAYPTDQGSFDVDFKDIDHVSSIYGSPMPYSVFYNGGEAFHDGDLGSRSHGCIRLSDEAAKKFNNSLQPGDRVVVRLSD